MKYFHDGYKYYKHFHLLFVPLSNAFLQKEIRVVISNRVFLDNYIVKLVLQQMCYFQNCAVTKWLVDNYQDIWVHYKFNLNQFWRGATAIRIWHSFSLLSVMSVSLNEKLYIQRKIWIFLSATPDWLQLQVHKFPPTTLLFNIRLVM